MRKQFPQFLKKLLKERQSRNERYSKRAFAKHCGISIGQLNDYLSGRRLCTEKTAKKILANLNLPDKQAEAFQSSESWEASKAHRLSSERFEIISDPIHFAFLALTTATDFVLKLDWIAEKLKISKDKVDKILHNLKSVGLIEVVDKKVIIHHEHVITTLDVPSEALRASHKKSLSRIISQLDTVPVEKRDVCSVSVCIDPKKLPLVKKRVLKFVEKTARFLEAGEKKEVYEINVQVFPWS